MAQYKCLIYRLPFHQSLRDLPHDGNRFRPGDAVQVLKSTSGGVQKAEQIPPRYPEGGIVALGVTFCFLLGDPADIKVGSIQKPAEESRTPAAP